MTPEAPKADNRDPAYLEHRNSLCRVWKASCFFCGARNGTVVTHHVRCKAVYGDKWNCLYACGRCHLEIHYVGRHTFCHINHLSLGQLLDEAKRDYDEYLETYGAEPSTGEDSSSSNNGVGLGR